MVGDPISDGVSLMRIRAAAVSVGITFVLIFSTISIAPRTAQALPSFARQTGQPCGQCHNAFPELTPYGRRFKLSGYTQGGGDEKAPKLSAMIIGGFTHTEAPQVPSPPGFNSNDNVSLEQFSAFYGGAITEHIGAFVQVTYDGIGHVWSWDNVDVRYAKNAKLFGSDVIFGITAHNSPTVQDVWNTTPAWGHPYISPGLAPAPAAATIIEGAFAQQVGGVGAYAFINDQFYVEVSGYKTLSQDTLRKLGVNPLDAPGSISGVAPYVRVAWEPHWNNHSLMIGAFGMVANVAPGWMTGIGTDRYTDMGFDTQYQYEADNGYLTLRSTYIHEKQDLNATFSTGGSTNPSNTLNSFKASATVIYNKQSNKVGLTAGYFSVTGSSDALLYVDNANFSPNSNGWMGEIFYIPFGMNQAPGWPWFNARLGLQYIYYNKFDGTTFKAKDNNTLFLYLWMAG
jgi:hypothetical protein